MVLLLYYLLTKKLGSRPVANHLFPVGKVPIRLLTSLVICLLLCAILMSAKCQQLNYKVVRNGSTAGWMKLDKKCSGNTCTLSLNSAVKLRVIVSLFATVFESASFTNNQLVFSSQYHKMNGKVEVDKQTRFTGNGYEVSEDNKKKKLVIPPVFYNLLCLYFQEPLLRNKVYCDKQQCFADIEKTKDGGYKVNFPNGNNNCFYYTGGICTRVKISHTFYSAEVILNAQNNHYE